MSKDENDAICRLIEHAKLYGIPPRKIDSQRIAGSMNRADEQLCIKRARKWSMGDQYFLLSTVEGPRFVMVL